MKGKLTQAFLLLLRAWVSITNTAEEYLSWSTLLFAAIQLCYLMFIFYHMFCTRLLFLFRVGLEIRDWSHFQELLKKLYWLMFHSCKSLKITQTTKRVFRMPGRNTAKLIFKSSIGNLLSKPILFPQDFISVFCQSPLPSHTVLCRL